MAAKSDNLRVTRKKLSDLTPDPHNANKGTERGLRALEDSIQATGLGRSIVTDKNGVVIGGNKTLERVADLGFEDTIVVPTDGNQLVVVQRTDLDLTDPDPNNNARKLAYFDNRSAELSLSWSPEQLQADKEAGVEIVDKLWHPVELDKLGVSNGEPPDDPGAQVDRAAELQEKWGVVRGDIWELKSEDGNRIHRIMCGDSTCAEDVELLMGGVKAQMCFTDPPYGVNYTGGAKPRKKLDNDNIGTDIYNLSLIHLKMALDDESALYLWYADAHVAAAAAAGYHITAQIIWVKNHAQFVSSAKYHGKHEPCFYAYRKGKSARWNGGNNEVTVWECDRSPRNDYHPTQKPVALAIRAINNSSFRSDIILDLFLGGGTTIVACEQTGRVGYGMEIAPEYVSVTLQRLADMGLSAERK